MNHADLGPFLHDATELPRSTQLLREAGLRTILLHLKPGEQIPEHQTRGALTIYCLKGKSALIAGAERVEVAAAFLVSLPPGAPHSVIAEQDTLLLLTLSDQPPPQSS